MNIALWITQGLLAAVFLASGIMKSTQTKAKLIASGQTGVAPFPLPVIRTVAALEIAAALGLIAPRLTGIVPVLTPLAAVGLIAVMIGAAIAHWSLREYKQVFGVNLVLLLLALFVAIGRF
ncbi:DoxX family protein [Streptomyces sp. NPDC092296]|uniref:DoxX family protein n=1 Tax=Streptomyces sp. NPDC092296 TaxID=3366012 RepID=UPI003826CBFA